MLDSWTSTIVVLGFGSCSVGLLAERTRPQRDDIVLVDGGGCIFPMSPAFPLALVATAMLLAAISMSTRCCVYCYRRRDDVSNTRFGLGILFGVFAWLVALQTVFFNLAGAALNMPGRRDKADLCYAVVGAPDLFHKLAFNGVFAAIFGMASDRMIHYPPPAASS